MKKRESGFTLIELLIVIAIIGILAAIAIPNLLNAVQRGKQKRTMSDMRSMATAVEAYSVDNNAYPPPTACGSAFVTDTATLLDASLTRLSPTYIAKIVSSDGWGGGMRYGFDTNNYVLRSFGRDKAATGFTCITTTDFNDDILYTNGTFVNWPEGTQQ